MTNNSISILIVDDQQSVIVALKDTLSELLKRYVSVKISTALSKDEALVIIRQTPHQDVVFWDLWMPKSTIEENIAIISEIDHDSPVLVITGMSEEEYKDRCLAAGASGFITKQNAVIGVNLLESMVLAMDRWTNRKRKRCDELLDNMRNLLEQNHVAKTR